MRGLLEDAWERAVTMFNVGKPLSRVAENCEKLRLRSQIIGVHRLTFGYRNRAKQLKQVALGLKSKPFFKALPCSQ